MDSFFESIIKCKAVLFIGYIMSGCFYGHCFRVDVLFLYVLLDEFSLTLFLAASVVERYIKGGVYMHFKRDRISDLSSRPSFIVPQRELLLIW